ncbi:MAG: flippase-like domain-containing protein, partial [Deltaproteobacteria bacterium]|nr:flippase-like domain-containing protein [Deltaproteobacteria bacterium]
IVVAERITDLIGLLLLALVGVFTFDVDRRFLGGGAVAVGLAVLMIGSETVSTRLLAAFERVGPLARFVPKLREFHAAAAALMRPAPLVVAAALSVASWFLECLAFWVVVHGFPGVDLGLQPATFIYAAMTIAGALSFLPGGLGITEAGMLALLTTFGTGIPRGTAAAATFVTRGCTLWFAVAIGVGALMIYSKRAAHAGAARATVRESGPLADDGNVP